MDDPRLAATTNGSVKVLATARSGDDAMTPEANSSLIEPVTVGLMDGHR